MIRLNQQQLNFFDTFGYLALPGLMARLHRRDHRRL